MTIKKPVIGITLDYVSEKDNSYSRYPWYALRADYSNAVEASGGIALLLPYQLGAISYYLNVCDGLIVSGGDFDIDPNMYGQNKIHEKVATNHKRTKFEYQLLLQYIKTKKPILGICGGQQLLNVVLGGTLIQHIDDEVQNPLKHEQDYPKNKPTHNVKCVPQSLLHQLVQREEFMVNTTHHQAVKALGKGLCATAVADDGVVEAIELTAHPFCLGVQWHPEFYVSEQDKAIMHGFVGACKQ